MHLRKWLHSEELNPVLLWFRKSQQEHDYRHEPDTQFRYYVMAAAVLFIAMTAIQAFSRPRSVVLWGSYGATFLALLLFLYLCWLEGSCSRGEVSTTPIAAPGDHAAPFVGHVVSSNRWLRLSVFLISISLISTCAVITLVDLEPSIPTEITILNEEVRNLTISQADPVPSYLYSSALSLAAISVFLRVGFILKLGLMLVTTAAHLVLYSTTPMFEQYYQQQEDEFKELPHQFKISVLLIVLVILLHVLDRQIEFTSRTDFLWRAKLQVEQEDVETMRGINKILLENILPAHVAEHFLATRNTQELYHERYSCIAVMFASIPNYKEFYDENDVNKQGLECLRLLNEIICDFDKLLLKPKFSCIEKIKTIGSTYMLASGLRPGKEEGSGDATRQEEHNIFILVDFAVALMTILDQINRESFQRFKLRIGLNHGPVIAGVVGAQKPQYDIWGNTVNVASRMDSCGVMGRIQVTEDTAKILMNAGYECECRGPTYVKGKGTLTTYFVKTPLDEK